MEPIISFKDVSKYFPLYHQITGGIKNFIFHLPSAVKQIRASKFYALKNINMEIFKGETFGVIGKNGAGKSTMLGLIAGVLKPSEGEIKIKGRIAPLLELGGGFHPDLTGRENITLNGILLGLTKTEVKSRMDQIIEFSELGYFIDQPIRTYSSGMLARLGFSVAVHTNPEIFLIDEVLAVGDVEFQKKCFDKMEEFKKKGVTIVLVSHSIEQVEDLCSQAIWIEKGQMMKLGASKEVADSYHEFIKSGH